MSNNSSGPAACYNQKDTSTDIAFKVIGYSFVLFLALIGNILVMFVVQRNVTMRKRPINLFIVNLAASDILLAVFVIPRLITEIILSYPGIWLVNGLLGLALCKIVPTVQDVATAVSVQSLVVIAIDRFCAVVYPLRIATVSCSNRLVVIPMTWFVALGLYAPNLYYYKLLTIDNKTSSCYVSWSDDPKKHKEIGSKYYMAMFSLFVIIPIIILFTLYSSIFYHLRIRGKKTNLQVTGSQGGKRKQQEWNVLKMALAIVVGFAVCCGPFNVLVFLRIFKWDIWIPQCYFKLIYFATTFLFYANSALNPFIYFAFSENFRLGFLRVFTRRSTKASSTAKCMLTSVKTKPSAEGINNAIITECARPSNNTHL